MLPARTRHDVLTRLQARAGEIRALGVVRLGLFGSFVRDEAGPASDVDLLVDFAPGEKSFDRFLDLAELLDRNLGRTVELLTREGLSAHIGPKILREVEDVPLGN
ncbi:MAG: nucleotidyltransferase family protein [Acidobacteriota bacterium]